jgi:cytochrome c biogenesis protein CcmG, thiol:disulfide interchange protein DsbE
MSALETGVRAPEIALSLPDGRKFSLSEARKRGPVVAAFFKVNCPTCQLAFPYLERIFKAYSRAGAFTMVGISQNQASDTEAFNREFGITFPVVLDESGRYPVSNAYGLTNVPSVFLISPEGEIESSTVGWSKADMEGLNRELAKISNLAPAQLFPTGQKVSEFKPG